MEKKRIYYLDIAKGIGVILMILGHISDLTTSARQFVTSFHMPLFFVISGMIICATGEEFRDGKEIFRRKFRSIMIPYFVFSVLNLVVEVFGTVVIKNNTWEVVREHLYATVCLSGASVFWFLPALFFGELIFIGVRKKSTAPVCGISVAALAALAYLGYLGGNRLQEICSDAWYSYVHLFLNAALRTFFSAAFIAAGYFGHGLLQKLTGAWAWNLLPGILLMGVTLAVSRKNGITDMNYMVYNNVLLYLVTSVCGSFGVIFLCRALERWYRTPLLRACMYYGRNSLIVMMTHAPFYIMYFAARFTYGVSNHIFPLGHIPLCAVMTGMVLLLEIPVCEVINRYLPFLLGRPFVKKNKNAKSR